MKKISIINLESTVQGDYIESCAHAFEELEIESLLKIKPQYISGKMTKFQAVDFFVADLQTIHHRLDIFEDLLEFNDIHQLMVDVLPIICSLREISQRREEPYKFIEYLYCLRDVQAYVDCVSKFYATFSKLESQIKSNGLKTFACYIKDIFEGDEFQSMKENLQKMDFRMKPAKSITVGINLNLDTSDEIIDDIGILSFNDYRIKSGKGIVERVRRSTGQDAETRASHRFITPIGLESKRRTVTNMEDDARSLTPTESIFSDIKPHQREMLSMTFKKAINTALKKTLKDVELEVSDYVRMNTAFLADLLPEFCFLIAGVSFINELGEKKLTLCKPQVSKNSFSQIKGLKNPHLLTTLTNEEIQGNDVNFDEIGMIYVLTGANSGGKSVFLQSIGIAQALFQLGLYIPATEAILSPSEHICVHFPSKVAIEVDGGRLEQECKMVGKILKEVSKTSFVLMDETFSSTSAYDASILAESMLKHLASIGCKGIFSTHIHSLGKAIDEINESETRLSKVQGLIAVTESGTRSYRIEVGRSEGHSHAKDIAKKYGLVFDVD